MLYRVLYNYILAHISDVFPSTVHLNTGIYFWCFIVYCTTRYWHKFLMLHSVLYHYILTHSCDVPSCTIEKDTGTYYWCFVVYCTTRYWDIFLILHASDDSSYTINPILAYDSDASLCTVRRDTGTYFWCFIVYCTNKYWHIFLMFHHVLHN
jgi:hypothetical protein